MVTMRNIRIKGNSIFADCFVEGKEEHKFELCVSCETGKTLYDSRGPIPEGSLARDAYALHASLRLFDAYNTCEKMPSTDISMWY